LPLAHPFAVPALAAPEELLAMAGTLSWQL
jgi:hypothetical protein